MIIQSAFINFVGSISFNRTGNSINQIISSAIQLFMRLNGQWLQQDRQWTSKRQYHQSDFIWTNWISTDWPGWGSAALIPIGPRRWRHGRAVILRATVQRHVTASVVASTTPKHVGTKRLKKIRPLWGARACPPPPSNDNSHHFPIFNFYFFLFLSLFHSRQNVKQIDIDLFIVAILNMFYIRKKRNKEMRMDRANKAMQTGASISFSLAGHLTIFVCLSSVVFYPLLHSHFHPVPPILPPGVRTKTQPTTPATTTATQDSRDSQDSWDS